MVLCTAYKEEPYSRLLHAVLPVLVGTETTGSGYLHLFVVESVHQAPACSATCPCRDWNYGLWLSSSTCSWVCPPGSCMQCYLSLLGLKLRALVIFIYLYLSLSTRLLLCYLSVSGLKLRTLVITIYTVCPPCSHINTNKSAALETPGPQ